MSAPLTIGLVGCGAVAEQYHAPALRALELTGRVRVATLTDRDERRLARLAELFPGARRAAGLPERGETRLAIVATPARLHAEQTIALLAGGTGVLCEKPLATSVADAGAMIAAASRSGAALGVGLVRRFFPAWQEIAHLVATGALGRLRRFAIEEGGPFNWPAATPSFFDPRQAGGGVLLDAGVHVLDGLVWWLGEPQECDYADDAEGGLEANCRLTLRYGTGPEAVTGSVRLSRDHRTRNYWRLEFEHATVFWRVGETAALEIQPVGSPYRLEADLVAGRVDGSRPADTMAQACTRQLLDLVDAVEQARAPRLSGTEALRSLRLIEACYARRRPLWPEVLR